MAYPSFSVGEVLTASDMNAVGLWLVKAETIGSGVSNHTISSCFSASYKNYFVQIETVFSALAARIYVRGTGSTGTTYAGNFFYMDNSSTTVFGANNASTSYFDVGLTSSTGRTNVNLWLYNINDAAVATRVVSQFAGDTYIGGGGGRDTATNSSTALYFQPASGTMTGGSVRVYGIKN